MRKVVDERSTMPLLFSHGGQHQVQLSVHDALWMRKVVDERSATPLLFSDCASEGEGDMSGVSCSRD